MEFIGQILSPDRVGKARTEHILLLDGSHWGLYKRTESKYQKIKLSDFTFIDHRRSLIAVIRNCQITLIRAPRGPRGEQGPQGSTGPSTYNTQTYGSAFNSASNIQTLSGATNPAKSDQYVTFTTAGPTNGITLNGSMNGLTLPVSGTYEAVYGLTVSREYLPLSVRLVDNGVEISGSEVTSNSTQADGVVQFSAARGDVISLANGLNEFLTMGPPPETIGTPVNASLNIRLLRA